MHSELSNTSEKTTKSELITDDVFHPVPTVNSTETLIGLDCDTIFSSVSDKSCEKKIKLTMMSKNICHI